MSPLDLSRRSVFIGAAASALLPMTEAVAQTAAAGGDWFSMVKQQHTMIAMSLDEVTAENASPSARKAALNKLAYQLTAHATAEENVIYPALAMNGMTEGSDQLYMQQAHAKVKNAQIDMDDKKDSSANDWLSTVKALQAAILEHAKQHEEADLFPKLQSKLSAAQNKMLITGYAKMFVSVKQIQVV